MIKFNLRYPKIIIFIICFVLSTLKSTIASVDGFIPGKMLYSDNKEPVPNGIIKVIVYGKPEKMQRVLETVTVTNGAFKVTNIPGLNADEIKIMAYPNDVDNQENPFDPLITDLKSAMANNDRGNEIILYVERSHKSESSQQMELLLKQNFPNPFNPSTKIAFDLTDPSIVSLRVYNMNGESVATLVNNERLNSGLNEFVFNASGLPSGIYVYRLTADGVSVDRKMILLK